MILLPHGCSCSEPSVNPKNWKTGGKSILKKNWRIIYYFRDPEFKDKYKYGKLIPIKGMNRFKTLEERRAATQLLIDEELYILKSGFNPITKSNNGPELELESEISPDTLIEQAIELAKSKITAEPSTISGIDTSCKYFLKSCRQLRYNYLRIGDLKRKHVSNILDNQQTQNNYTNKRFNKIRAYMQMIFKKLVIADALEHNLIDGIEKKKETKRIKENFSQDEIKKIKIYLIKNHPNFYRYLQIFFHSGSRNTELFRIKKKDVDIKNQRFKVLVKKGRYNEEQWRAINFNVKLYWIQLYELAGKDDYIFSYNFSPGSTKIASRQVTDKWRKYIKKRLGIDKNFYLFKHLHTTMLNDIYDKSLSAGINGHKSTKMNSEHYDLNHRDRIIEKAKHVNISL